ncbi:phosphatidate cytidylyltransferase [Candidatus Pelagibacter sp. HIMB1695]|uniref:phosphatidate cytidylyltransferase n=1 Tax=Candidatus Pelagibacter sp. HIMB1695 TaxID=3413364 RepID=UPI003F855107
MSSELIKRIFSSIILLPILIYLIIQGSLYFNLLLIFCFVISTYEWNNIAKTKQIKLVGLIFLILSFFSIYKLRNEFYGEYNLVFFVLLICISTDLGGYIFGKTFKGPKLTKISPQKTYSGVLGSFIISYFCSINYFYFFNNFFSKVSLLEISIIIVLISFVSQIGDLIISYFKRISNMKDTGQLIPGHGGILDRIDGMIFAFPLFYFLFATNIFK